MKPILFDKTATQFNTNGIGRLDCVECLVIEERNGQYELEMTISQESQYASDIGMESIIVVKPNDSDPLQAFRVYQITKPIGGLFEVFANHIRYQLNYIPTMPFSVSASTSACAQTLAGLKNNAVSNCPFIFHTDVQTVASYQQNLPASIGTMMGGTAGSVIDQFGGEWKYDNYDVYLYHHRGVQNPTVTFRYGKDITDLKQEEEIANTITGIVPFWTDSEGAELVTLPEKVVESPNASNFTFKRIVTIDFSGDFENKPTQNALRTHAQAYINKAGIGIPNVSIDVSFIDLAKTMEYEDLLQFQSVNLCDIVGISFVNLGIDTTAKIVKVVYNVLKERYESIEIGAVRSSVAHTLNNTNASVIALADTTKTNFAKAANETDEKISDAETILEEYTDGKVSDAVSDMEDYTDSQISTLSSSISQTYSTKQEVRTAVDNATAWLTATGSVVRALTNQTGTEWTDLLFCSQTATASSGNVLRINSNGMGFSSTGWNGNFTQAWTLDGKLVIGGTNVPSLTVYDNNDNIIFQTDATKIIWNATNSSMAADGTITSKDGNQSFTSLSNGAINFGYNNQTLATLNCRIKYNEEGTQVVYLYLTCDKFFLDTTSDIRQTSSSGKITLTATSGAIKLDGQSLDFDSENGSVSIRAKGGIATFASTTSNTIIQSTTGTTSITGYENVTLNSNGEIKANTTLSMQEGNYITGYEETMEGGVTGGKIRFDRVIDNNDNNVEIDSKYLVVDGNMAMKKSNNVYQLGFTGRFRLKNQYDEVVTLNFLNGVLVE